MTDLTTIYTSVLTNNSTYSADETTTSYTTAASDTVAYSTEPATEEEGTKIMLQTFSLCYFKCIHDEGSLTIPSYQYFGDFDPPPTSRRIIESCVIIAQPSSDYV